MRRLIASSAAVLLLLLLSQAVMAQYEPSGSLTVTPPSVAAGGQVTIDGSGFAPGSEVRITVQETPVLLTTVTTDAAGGFSVVVTVPGDFAGAYTVVATGVDASGSIHVLTANLNVIQGEVLPIVSSPKPSAAGLPATSQTPSGSTQGSDPVVLTIAGAGIVAMTGIVLLVATRRRRSQGES